MTTILQIDYTDTKNKPYQVVLDPHTQTEAFIGRRDRPYEPTIDLHWDHGVSRRHARLFYDYGTWYIEHLNPSNQTHLNGIPLVTGVPQQLATESHLTVGKSVLHLRYTETETMPEGNLTTSHFHLMDTPQDSEEQRILLMAHLGDILAQTEASTLDKLLAEIRQHFPTATSGGIALYQHKDFYLPSFFPREGAHFSSNLARQALRTQQILHWNRVMVTGESQQFTSLAEANQALYVPLIRGVEKLGVIFLHTHTEFTPTETVLLATVGEIINANQDFQPETAHLRLPSVFVSYSHDDADFVKKLVKDLRRQRVMVWFDAQLKGGEDWEKQLAQAIRQSDALALVMSPKSLASKYVRWEIEQARAAHKTIFPLLHQDSPDIPADINRLQWIDLMEDYVAGVLKLTEDLYQLSGEVDKVSSEPVSMRSANGNEKTRLLFLAANPKDSDPLRLGEEIRTIQERIRGGKHREHFDAIQQGWAVRYHDLQQYLLEHRPHIVHFSGHGSRDGAIILEDSAGKSQPVSKKTLKLLFKALKETGNPVQMVVLNACFSAEQAEAIAEEVECVLGMSRAVSDGGAIEFAGALYHALTFCQSVQTAFNLAEAAMSLSGEEETPQLLGDTRQFYFCMEKE